ncbi:uncharacterized protein LOC135716245 [Ochlerotatus camptorhynchus]|uniref:uncharacterized protein LOC135716245 n=1 Tax=Ochlerotatus camptorhynchus TaxID=644619 RepID=UPI0031E19387
MSDNSNLKRFLEREFARVNGKIEKVEQQNRNILAHFRTTRELLTNYGNELKELRELKRTFPLDTLEEIQDTMVKFADPQHDFSIKREIAYALSNAANDDWLRVIIADKAINEYRRSDEIRNLNFIRHIINNITLTPEKIFTGLVAAAKGRIYAKQRRDAKKRPHSEGSKENTKPSNQQPGCSQTKTNSEFVYYRGWNQFQPSVKPNFLSVRT